MSAILPDARTLPSIDDRDAGAELLELRKDVAADQDGLAERPEFPEEFAKLDPRPWVESRCRLVEEEHLRVVDEGVGQAEPLLHAARQSLDVGVALVGEVHEFEQVADDPLPGGRGQAVAASEEVEVLPDPHVVVDPEHVRHEPEDAPDLGGVPGQRPTADLGLARGRLEQGREHPERSRLASPVGPDQAEDLALLDRRGPRPPPRASGRSASAGPRSGRSWSRDDAADRDLELESETLVG